MNNFLIEITSPPDRDNLVAEVWHNNQMILEVNQEKDNLEVEFCMSRTMSFDYSLFIIALEKAKERLVNGNVVKR